MLIGIKKYEKVKKKKKCINNDHIIVYRSITWQSRPLIDKGKVRRPAKSIVIVFLYYYLLFLSNIIEEIQRFQFDYFTIHAKRSIESGKSVSRRSQIMEKEHKKNKK
jgi:hypothetical protein